MLRRLLVLLLIPAGAALPLTSPAAAAPPTEVNGVTEALAAARQHQRQVEVGSKKSPTTRVWANPSGSLTAEVNAVPVRLRRSGQWLDFDMTLQRRPDGTVAPRVHPDDLVLSGVAGAGEHDLATVSVNGERLGMGWSGALPAPVLNGATATYREVMAGVDLVVEARTSGFEQFFVAANPEAAARVAGLRMPMRSGNGTFTTNGDGTGQWTDRRGTKVAGMPVARMWDAQGRDEKGEHRRQARVGVGARAKAAEIGLDLSWLNDPATRYPVTIDPGFSVDKPVGFDEFVQNTISVSDNQHEDLLKLGYSNDSTCLAESSQGCRTRSYLKFNSLSGYAGSKIYSARLYLWEFHSWSCTAYGWRATRTDAVSGSVQWGNEPTWRETASTSTETRGAGSGSCGDGWVSTDVAPLMPDGFSAGSLSLAVHSAGDNGPDTTWSLSDHDSWKKFDSNEGANKPKILMEYNHLPTVSLVKIEDDSSCGSGLAFRKYLTTLRPKFSAKVSDTDVAPAPSSNVKLRVRVTPVGGAALPVVESLASAPNSTITINWPTDLNANTIYTYQVQGFDLTPSGTQLDVSAWSAPCEFGFDGDALQSPPIVEVPMLDDGNGGMVPVLRYGQPTEVTFRPGPGDEGRVAGYRYGFSQDEIASPNATTVVATSDGSAKVIVVNWSADGFGIPNGDSTLWVRAIKITGSGNGDSTLETQTFNDIADPQVPTYIPGDVHGDGRADLAGYRSLQNNRGLFYVYPGVNDGSLHDPSYLMDSPYSASNSKVVQGDFNGDGKTDFTVLLADDANDISLKALASDGNRLLDTPVWSSLLVAPNAWALTALQPLAADVNNDGRSDLVVGYPINTSSWTLKVFLSNGIGNTIDFADPVSSVTVTGNLASSKLVAGRFDLAAGVDIAEFRDLGTCRTSLLVHSSNGATYNAGVQKWDSGANGWCLASSTFTAGEMTGLDAGLDAIAATYDATACATRVHRFDPNAAGVWSTSQKWASPGGTQYWCYTWVEPALRDLSGDGKADLVLSYTCCGAYQQRIWTMTSTGTTFAAPVEKWQGALGALGVGNLKFNPSTRYQLVAKHSGKCLSISGGSFTQSAAVTQQTCSATARHQQFTFEQRGAIYVRAHFAHQQDKCLNVAGAVTTDGTAIVQYTCTAAGQANESFSLEYVTGLRYIPGDTDEIAVKLLSNLSQKCIGISGSSLSDGVAAVEWTCNGSNDQTYFLRPLTTNLSTLYGVQPDGRMTFTQISPVTGDRLGAHLVSADPLPFTPVALAAMSLDTVLVTSNTGALYRVDITDRQTSLAFAAPIQLAASGWTHTTLTYDGVGHLFGVRGDWLEQYSMTKIPSQGSDIAGPLYVGSGLGLTTLTATGPSWVIGSNAAGLLRSFRMSDGAPAYNAYTLAASGWNVSHVIASGNGAIFAHNLGNGGLFRHQDNNPYDGVGTDMQSFAADPVDTSGWTQTLLTAVPNTNVGAYGLAGPALVTDNGDGTMTTHQWSSDGSGIAWYRPKANGTFDLTKTGNRVATGDVDGNGKVDIVTAKQNTDGTFSFHVFVNGATTATVFYTSGPFGLDKVAGRIAVADFTGDGKADVALVYDMQDGTTRIYRWTSTGTAFGSLVTWTSGSYQVSLVLDRVATGDVNSDGLADIVMGYKGSNGAGMYVFLGGITSQGSWLTDPSFDLDKVGNRFVVADFTGDGRADVGMIYGDGASLSVCRWRSTGSSFASAQCLPIPGLNALSVGERVSAGDVTGDNIADLVAAYDMGDGTVGYYVFPNALSYAGNMHTTGQFNLTGAASRMVLARW